MYKGEEKKGKEVTQCAIKIFKENPQFAKAAKQEIKILKFLNQLDSEKSSIVKMRNSFEEKGQHVLVFDLLQRNLLEVLKKSDYKGLNLTFIKAIGTDILNALCFFLSQQIVHADLKPENIMFTPTKVPLVQLIDFGSANYAFSESLFTYV